MKKKKHSYFKDDIRRILLLYAFFPAVILTFLLLLMFWGYWKMDVERTNIRENEGLQEILEDTVHAYSDFIEDIADEEEIYKGKLDAASRADILTASTPSTTASENLLTFMSSTADTIR